MSQDSASTTSATGLAPGIVSDGKPDHVYLVSYPKIVFLYPTVLTSLFCAVVMWAKGDIPADAQVRDAVSGLPANPAMVMRAGLNPATDEQGADAAGTAADAEDGEAVRIQNNALAAGAVADDRFSYHHVCARIFLIVFALNMVVISFDFPRTTSLTWFFAFVAIVVGIWFLLSANPGLAPQIVGLLLSIKPWANASFYMIYALIMLALFVWVLISRRFDYWEVRGNELLHHHGFLSNLIRYSAPNLRIDKEVNDLFEYLLLRSGRLIIHPSNERRAIVLENVLFINSKEDRITRMLGALQVRVRTDSK